MFATANRILRPALLLVMLVAAAPAFARGQSVGVGRPLVQPASAAEDRMRLDQLFDSSKARPDFLIRSASTLTPGDTPGGRIALAVIAPELDFVTNSSLPFSLNDGPLWAGRGASTMLTVGATATWGRYRAIVAPQFWYAENRPFQVIPYPENAPDPRSPWANNFHPLPSSIDLPYRFGDQRILTATAGQSSISADVGRVTAGFGTENLWWGPGAQNAIVMSNNAPGFPHAFARTNGGWHTKAGRFDAEWILGTLRESAYFDTSSTNNARSISGLVVVWTPAADSGLSLGVARTVWANTRAIVPIGAIVDVFRDVGHPDTDTSSVPGKNSADQILSLFGRWVFPGAGFEVYGEWARFELPSSFRDFLEYPQHSQAYTVGLQWARPVHLRGGDARLRVQAEGTYLEPDPAQRVRPVGTTYTSRVVPQGYTNRGQSLGAAIGPGSSSQWLTVDLFGARGNIGAYLQRIRWDNAVVWDVAVPEAKAEDVSLIMGLRGGLAWRGVQVGAGYAHAVRLDYLYQDRVPLPNGLHDGVDILNNTFSLTLTKAISR